jgi:SAM-dependent methyltransferase
VSDPVNAAERQRWNDPAWTAGWVPRERLTGSVTAVLLDHLALVAGESALDVGCGGGQLTLAMADEVGDAGRVTGVDFSTALVDLARSRAAEAEAANVTFVLADAQTDAIPGRPFDVVASQFGVMFFDDPRAAFANIADQVGTDGRLGFACWGPIADNPWCVSPTIAPFLPPPPSVPAGALPTGPFAFGDPDLVTGLLTGAGWVAVERTPYERRCVVERAALVDDAHALTGVAPGQRAVAERALEEHLDRFDSGDDRFEVPLVFQVFTARRGS